MAELARVRVRWEGWNGGPGVSTFFMTGTDYSAPMTALNAFWEAVKYFPPAPIVITVEGSGDIIDDATGALTGQWQHGPDTAHTCAGSTAYTAASGALVRWNTSQIHNGRRLQGRTFLVPMQASAIGANGLLATTNLQQLQTAADNLVANSGGSLAVWGRPRKATATLPAAGGVTGSMTTATAQAKVAVLRSRRD